MGNAVEWLILAVALLVWLVGRLAAVVRALAPRPISRRFWRSLRVTAAALVLYVILATIATLGAR